jgi:deoxyribonuclease-4
LKKLPFLGAHVSVAGGLYNAPELGLACGCDVIQIFARYPTRWKTPDLVSEDVEKFKQAQEKTGVHAVATHASYLINLASSSPSLYERSIEAMAEEMKRAAMLGIENVVVHPGSAKDKDFDGAISRVAGAMRDLADGIDGAHICLETTAGQGTSVGYKLSHIGEIIERSGCAERMYVCLDSCHLYAAGYDISTKEGFKRLTAELESLGLTEKVRVIHLKHIGEGMIGLQGFSHLLNHPPFRDVPFILETPKGDDPIKSDSENLSKLRKLIKRRKG